MKCFLDGRKLLTLPHHVDLIKCSNCGEFELDDQWVKKELDDAIIEIALSKLAIIPEAKIISVGPMVEKQEDKTFVVHIQVDMDVNGISATDEGSTIVRLKNGVCKRCSRQLGSYYESILQLRSGEKNLSDELREEVVLWVKKTVETQAKNNRELFITKIQKAVGGVDFYLSSISMGKSLTRDLADKYGADTKESASLVGQTSDGQDMYRVTFLVRMPAYHLGDIVEYDGKPHKISAVNKSGGKLMNLTNFRELSVKKSELLDAKILFKEKDVVETTVVSSSGNEIQVLHPKNYSTVDIRIPKGTKVGELVRVAEVEDELFFVP